MVSHDIRLILWCILGVSLLSGCEQLLPQNSVSKTTVQMDQTQSAKNPTETMALSEKPAYYYQKSADKRSESVERYIRSTFKMENKPLMYYYNFVDLNEDGVHETLVLVQSNSGQQMLQELLILSSDGTKIAHIKDWKAPVIVSNEIANAYKVLYKSIGKGVYEPYAFDGLQYRLKEGKGTAFNDLSGIGYLSDTGEKRGFQLK